MRAAIYERYGAPDVVHLAGRAKPTPAAGEVLVRVDAASVGASDNAARSGEPGLVRLFSGIRSPRLPVLGSEYAGEIVAVGSGVTGLEVGDRVYGATGAALGCHAEHITVRADSALASLPPEVTPSQAVALADGAMTALPFLRDHGRVRPGMRVLVNGASGSVGAAGVQLAHLGGAHVTAVTSTPNLDLVRGLGGDEAIDYTAVDFTTSAEQWDIIFDAVGIVGFARARHVLTPHGRYLSTVPGSTLFHTLVSRRAKIAFTGLRKDAAKRPDLAEPAGLAVAGDLVPLIDSEYSLADAAAAHARVATGRKRGTVVLRPQE